MSIVAHIQDLGVTLGGRSILSQVSAEIGAGEFIGIFGPNGAGKSTLLRCLLGTLRPSQGSIRVLGRPARKAGRLVGYMPQDNSGAQTWGLSGRAILTAICHGERWGLPWPTVAQRAEVERVLRLTEAEAYADRPFAVLSGGERQRIMLAQALLGEPQILALDEPLAGLDPKHQGQLVALTAQIQQQTGATVLFVGHDPNPLIPVLDRVFYLVNGRAILGSVQEVITSEALSKLYGTEMKVVEVEGRIYVLSPEGNILEHVHHD